MILRIMTVIIIIIIIINNSDSENLRINKKLLSHCAACNMENIFRVLIICNFAI